jgi:hypothetical protein
MLKKDETCEKGVLATQTLESGDTNIVSVALKTGTTGTWTVTAKSKGSTTLRVVDKTTKEVARTIQATVVNTAPERKMETIAGLLEMAIHGTASQSFDLDPKMDTLYTINVGAFTGFFKDADGAGDLASYDITADTPYVLVRNYDAVAGLVLVDVVNKAADSFGISIVAVDDDDEKSKAVSGTVRWQPARSKGNPYTVEQFNSGMFSAEDIELRWGDGVTHQLKFEHPEIVSPGTARTGNVPLEFIVDWEAGVSYPKGSLDAASTLSPPGADAVDDNKPPPDELVDDDTDTDLDIQADNGLRWIEITPDSPIKVTAYEPDDGTNGLLLTFELRGSGASAPTAGTAKITFTQKVVYDADGTGTKSSRQVQTAGSAVLTLNIVRVE